MKHIQIELPKCLMHAYIPDVVEPVTTLRPSIVICPGGGYRFRSDREAEPIALVFAAKGFNCFVAEYAVAPEVGLPVYPAALFDVAHAVAWVREHAAEYCADPNAIAVMGFSAGGHAACHLGVRWHEEELMASFGLTPAQAQPNAMVLCYSVITAGPYAHRGSFEHLTGSKDLAIHAQFSLEEKVTAHTPPTFLWHTWEDGAVPVENSLFFACAMRRCGVQGEVHVFPKGGHGLSLANPLTSDSPAQNIPECAQWPDMAARFLRTVL